MKWCQFSRLVYRLIQGSHTVQTTQCQKTDCQFYWLEISLRHSLLISNIFILVRHLLMQYFSFDIEIFGWHYHKSLADTDTSNLSLIFDFESIHSRSVVKVPRSYFWTDLNVYLNRLSTLTLNSFPQLIFQDFYLFKSAECMFFKSSWPFNNSPCLDCNMMFFTRFISKTNTSCLVSEHTDKLVHKKFCAYFSCFLTNSEEIVANLISLLSKFKGLIVS